MNRALYDFMFSFKVVGDYEAETPMLFGVNNSAFAFLDALFLMIISMVKSVLL